MYVCGIIIACFYGCRLQNPEFGTSDAQAEAQQQIDSKLEEMRQVEVQVTKAEARLESLRGAGIDVHKWLQKAKDSHKNDQLQPSTLGKLATKLIASESDERFYLKIFYNVFINISPLSLSLPPSTLSC